MKKYIRKYDEKAIDVICSLKAKRFRKGDGGVFTLVIGAAIGTLVLIGFYLVAKDGLSAWGSSFKSLVSM